MAASLVRRRIVNAWPGRLAGLTLLLGFGSADVCAIELIENGSFEDAEHIGIAGWDNGSGVGNDIGFTAPLYPFFFGGQVEYGELSFESPPNRPPDFSGTLKPFGGGNSFGRSWGAANGNGRGGSATQIVDIGLLADRRFTFSAWMASFRDDPEYAILSLEFFTGPGGAGESIESIVFDGSDQGSEFIVGSMNLDGMADPMIPATDDNWTLYRAAGTIPSAADSAAVVIRGISPPGSSTSGNDGFVDLVSLQVVPEPRDGRPPDRRDPGLRRRPSAVEVSCAPIADRRRLTLRHPYAKRVSRRSPGSAGAALRREGATLGILAR